ncbi:hypothetical protein HDV00_009472 [Rhizophlyctis rosea]|nr:hypothetical protein HDV00_009472 [Rhizophlyctis rosea]
MSRHGGVPTVTVQLCAHSLESLSSSNTSSTTTLNLDLHRKPTPDPDYTPPIITSQHESLSDTIYEELECDSDDEEEDDIDLEDGEEESEDIGGVTGEWNLSAQREDSSITLVESGGNLTRARGMTLPIRPGFPTLTGREVVKPSVIKSLFDDEEDVVYFPYIGETGALFCTAFGVKVS